MVSHIRGFTTAEDRGKADDDENFSELDLVNHFKGESREMKRYVIDWIRNSVTTHTDNKLRDYIDYGGRGTDMPLRVDAKIDSVFITWVRWCSSTWA